jgi:Cytochrome c7 and related cytochrome c
MPKRVHKNRLMRRNWQVLGILLFCVACTVLGSPQDKRRVAVQEWLESRGPVVPHDTFPDDCMTCHEGGGWHTIRSDFNFDHESETGVALEGAHKQAECLRCHNDRGPVANFSGQGCVGCHEEWHQGKLGSNCSACHDATTWKPKQIVSKHAMTRFPLIGAHAGTACWACHPGAQVGEFKRASSECVVCHRDQLARATVPDHQGNGWTTRCQRCHSPIGWNGASFVHDSYPLTGAHKSVACTSCHINNVYQGTPRDCMTCHITDYNTTTNPNHQQASFPTTCEACHNTSSWNGAAFTHSFPRNGPHDVSCATCHDVPGNFQVFTCLVCHDHNKTKMDDKHKGENGYTYTSPACLSCHPNGKH